MIEIGLNKVEKNFGFKNVLNGVDLDIMTGDRVAIVGKNGGGKSTILKLIAGLECPDKGTVSVRRGATIGYLEQIPSLTSPGETARDMLMNSFGEIHDIERRMRDIEAELETCTDAQATDLLLRRYTSAQNSYAAVGGYEFEEDFNRIVTGFGIGGILDRPFNVLSGGQKTVVKLACVMLRRNDILLLDEPTNHLDVSTLEWFEDLVLKYGGTVVMVSHDRQFLDRASTKTAIISGGLCETYGGNYSYSIKERERQLLLEFKDYKNQQKKIEAMRAAIKRYRERGDRKATELEHRLERMEVLDKPDIERHSIPISFAGGRSGREVLRVESFSIAFGENELFDQADMLVREREKVCLVGDNGAGKTTLMRAVLGEIGDFTGKIVLPPSVKPGYIRQEIRFGDDTESVLESFKREHVCTEGDARNILARYFFTGDNVYKRVGALSGGEKVFLKLASLMRREVNLLILDEPTNHIDIDTREMLEEALGDYRGTLLFISHDRYFIRKLAGRIINIENRKLVSYIDYDEYRKFTGR